MEELPIWQPVSLILRGKRLECLCGARAIFVTGTVGEEQDCLKEVGVYCQACFMALQEDLNNID
jgi:hypothetical protein